MLQFVNVETLDPETEAKIRLVLESLHPRFVRWLKDVYVSDDTVTLSYNINNPTEKSLQNELDPLLKQHGLPAQIDVKKVRPGVLHSSAIDFLNQELKPRSDEDNYISDLTWIDESARPFILYLSQYRFICDNWESEVIGLDQKESTLYCKQSIVGIEITEDQGDDLLKRWS